MMSRTEQDVIGYLRLSTGERNECAVDELRSKLMQGADSLELRVVALYADLGSFDNQMNLPGFYSAMQDLESGLASHLLVVDFASLGDGAKDLAQVLGKLNEAKATLTVLEGMRVIEPRDALLIVDVLRHIGAHEAAVKAKKIRMALGYKRAKGKKLGAPCFGSAAEDAVIVDEIKQMRKRRLSYRSICEALMSADVKSPRGQVWHPTTVKRMWERSLLE